MVYTRFGDLLTVLARSIDDQDERVAAMRLLAARRRERRGEVADRLRRLNATLPAAYNSTTSSASKAEINEWMSDEEREEMQAWLDARNRTETAIERRARAFPCSFVGWLQVEVVHAEIDPMDLRQYERGAFAF